MYYRGSRVPLSEKSPRFNTAGMTSSVRFRSSRNDGKEEGKNRLFLKLFEKKEKPVVRQEQKAYAFYRRGVTPVEDTPGFSKKERSWVTKAPSLKSTMWLFKLAGLALLVLALIWSKNKTTAVLQDVAGLKLEKVSVEGNHYLSEDEIVKTVALPLGESMFKLDLNEAGEKVRQMDWVERVFVERRLPRTILISVRERKPVALLDNGSLYGVDREGRVLSPEPALLQEDLPLISGIPLKVDAVGTTNMAQALEPALDFFSSLRKKDPVMAQDVSEVNLSEPDSIKVTFIDGIQAIFTPPVDESELKRMALVLSDLNEKGKRAGTMDFRYRDMVLVKTEGGQ
jgi:cell division septal protein FtsQ